MYVWSSTIYPLHLTEPRVPETPNPSPGVCQPHPGLVLGTMRHEWAAAPLSLSCKPANSLMKAHLLRCLPAIQKMVNSSLLFHLSKIDFDVQERSVVNECDLVEGDTSRVQDCTAQLRQIYFFLEPLRRNSSDNSCHAIVRPLNLRSVGLPCPGV